MFRRLLRWVSVWKFTWNGDFSNNCIWFYNRNDKTNYWSLTVEAVIIQHYNLTRFYNKTFEYKAINVTVDRVSNCNSGRWIPRDVDHDEWPGEQQENDVMFNYVVHQGYRLMPWTLIKLKMFSLSQNWLDPLFVNYLLNIDCIILTHLFQSKI